VKEDPDWPIRPPCSVKEFGFAGRDIPVLVSPDFDLKLEEARLRLAVASADLAEPISAAAAAYELVTATLEQEIRRLEKLMAEGDEEWMESDAGVAHDALLRGLQVSLLVFDPENMRQAVAMAAEAREVLEILGAGWFEIESDADDAQEKSPDS
jgi:hypothetical protein